MSLRDKLSILSAKKQELVKKTSTQLVSAYDTTQLNISESRSTLQNALSELKKKNSYPTSFSISTFIKKIRLIIILDSSFSMNGTEVDIYNGIKELCEKHSSDNIILTWVTFNDQMKYIYKDEPIFSVEPRKIVPHGNTNLNETLYKVFSSYGDSDNIQNLFVTISDGANNRSEVKAEDVADLMYRMPKETNNYYFIGESNSFINEEKVRNQAIKLGFCRNNIEVYSRSYSGNAINFKAISNMLNDLLKTGVVRPNWSEPIRENYLRLKDSKRR